MSASELRGWSAWPKRLLVALALLTLLAGVRNGFPADAWDTLPQLGERAFESLGFAAAAVVGMVVAARLGMPVHGVAFVPLAVAALAFVAPAGIAASLLVIAVAGTLGERLAKGRATPPIRLLLGFAVLSAIGGWLAPWPLHAPGLWCGALLVVLLLDRRIARQSAGEWRVYLATRGGPAGPAMLFWGVVVAVATLPAWLPIRNPDDLAYHVGLIHEWIEYGQARFDVGTQVWALSPWGIDVLHAQVSLMAGGETTGVLNVFWMLLVSFLIADLAVGAGASRRAGWLAAAVFASLPMSSFLSGGLQTELPTAAVLAALACVVLHGDPTDRRTWGLVAVLAGFALAAKVSNALLILPLGLWWFWRARGPHVVTILPIALPLGLLAGGSSYAYAWALTGNPILPVMNGLFESPWFAATNFIDATWQTGFAWTMPWDLFADTRRYFEAITPGVSGITPWVLLAAVPALFDHRTRPLAALGIAAFALVIAQTQYLRYPHPAMALLVPAVCAAAVTNAWSRGLPALGVAVVVVHLALVPGASWMFRQGALAELVVAGREGVLRRFVPERLLMERFRAMAREDDRLLVASLSRHFTASLPGRASGIAWYSPRLESLAANAPGSADTWRRIVRESGANALLVHPESDPAGVQAFLEASDARRVDREGGVELWSLPSEWQAQAASSSEPKGHRLSWVVDARFAWIGRVRATVPCTVPGAPVAVRWVLQAGSAVRAERHEWRPCPDSGVLGIERAFLGVRGVDRVEVGVMPAREADAMVLGSPSGAADLRRDLAFETSLAAGPWPVACDSAFCRTRRPRWGGDE